MEVVPTVRWRLSLAALSLLFCLLVANSAHAQISKGYQILTNRGFQVQGMVTTYDPFSLATYTNANYTAINWLWDSTPSAMGTAPGFPWARWARGNVAGEMPPVGAESSYLSQLVAIQLGDEWDLNVQPTNYALIQWFGAVRTNWPNAILYHNNYGGQVLDTNLNYFIASAQPDMISFDSYPFRTNGSGSFSTIYNWYGDARRYREYSKGYGIPLATYMQTYYSSSDGTRSPSPSELRLNHSAAMAFNAKMLIDFTYNSGASALFNNGFGGDNSPNALYYEKADAALRARNLGKALVRLKPANDAVPNTYTTGMMFIRGRDSGGNLTPVVNSFLADPQDPSYTDWAYQRNDPYLTNTWTVVNKGTKNNGYSGDVMISWFNVLDETLDGTNYSNEVYLMVVNGLSDPTGTAADCLQEITLNFRDGFLALEMLNATNGNVQIQPLPLTNGYRQLVLNLNGGDAALFKFSDGAPFVGAQVVGPPVITAQTSSQTNNAGTTAIFSALAAGSAPLTYRWQFQGTNLPGATTNTLTRTNLQAVDAGSYRLIVTNSLGSATSAVAVLTVLSPPQITTQPQSQTVSSSSNVLFNVGATGPLPFTYQWLFNGSNIYGATGSSYTRTNAQSSDAGAYGVVVSNPIGPTLSSNAILTVNGPPSITSQPKDKAVLLGSPATFNVAAVGSGALIYQWRKDGVNITNGTNTSGATNAILIISNAQSADLGSYSVTVGNAYGIAASTPATLTIASPPTIQVQPQSRTNNAGTLALFNVSASGNGLTYQWQRLATNLSDSGNIAGALNEALAVSEVTTMDAADYRVIITNSAGSITSSPATLTVLFAFPVTEPFLYPVGTNLAGQISPDYLSWADVGTNTAGPVVAAGTSNLDVAGLAPSTGNSIRFGGLGKSARFSFQAGHPVTTGTIYFSFAFKVLDLTGASASGGFFAGFNNSVGSQGNQPSVVGPRVYLHATNGGFNLGVAKNSDTDWYWDTATYNTNQTLFLVGSYTFTTSGNTTDDIAKLWINPDPSTFGAPSPPATGATAASGSDISGNQIASFVFFQRSTTLEPALMMADELRIDTTWAGVTPPGLPVIVSQPANQVNNPGTTATFSVSAGGNYLTYLWFRNGVALNDGGNVFGASTATLSLTNVAQADAGRYTVLVSSGAGSVLSAPADLTVTTPPQISTQPQNQSVSVNATAAFTVVATGTGRLNYQWRFNGTNISNATASSYSRSNIQRTNAGSYSVFITNVAGSVLSSNALLTVTPITPLLIGSVSRVPGNQIRLQGSGDPGYFIIQGSSNLISWSDLTNIYSSSGSFEFIDGTTNGARRFYRARLFP